MIRPASASIEGLDSKCLCAVALLVSVAILTEPGQMLTQGASPG